MAVKSIKPRLADILEAIEGIKTTINGSDFETYYNTWPMRRAVERGLEIISEASRHIPPAIKSLAPYIPWEQISAIGNVLRHEYHRVDDRIVWNITDKHLLDLEEAIRLLLQQTD